MHLLYLWKSCQLAALHSTSWYQLVAGKAAARSVPSCSLWWFASRHQSRLSRHAVPLSADTDVQAAIAAVMEAAGRSMGPTDKELVQRLQENWYNTAGDVVAMTQEELEMLNVPVKLWAMLKTQLDKSDADITPTQCHHRQQEQDQQEPKAANPAGDSTTQAATAAATAAAVAVADQAAQLLPADIMERCMPTRVQASMTLNSQQHRVRRSPLLNQEPYGLMEHEMTDGLRAEMSALEKFSTTRFFGQLVEPLAPVTYRTVTLSYVKLILGFAHRVRGVPLDQLSLSTLLPSAGREGASLIMDYQHWRQQERGTSASTATLPIKAAIHVARFLYHDRAKPCSNSRELPYEDIEVIQELRRMQRTALKAASGAARVADDSKKWLEWDDYLQLVKALRAECAGLTAAGKPRVRSEVASSLQRYLIAAILSVIPDRQRTLRELEVGRTLLQRDDGSWVIKHGPGDYKTGKMYGDRPPLVIAPFIYPELEAFINTWRKELQPTTNRLFVKPRSGEPMDENTVYTTLKHAAMRLTGKATHPHLVRDMIVTHLRTQRKGEAAMEALALYMGHSIKMQRQTYDRRTKQQRLTPAVELLQGLSQRLTVGRRQLRPDPC